MHETLTYQSIKEDPKSARDTNVKLMKENPKSARHTDVSINKKES